MLKVGAGECTTHFHPREPETSLTFTCIKSECPAQARMGGCGGFKCLVHYNNYYFFLVWIYTSINTNITITIIDISTTFIIITRKPIQWKGKIPKDAL